MKIKAKIPPLYTAAAEKPLETGDLVPGSGIFLCRWEPEDLNGRSLGKVFNVFAAPCNLTEDADGGMNIFTFNEAMQRVSGLKKWHGFDGRAFVNSNVFLQALKDDNYKGEWVIPPLELLSGYNAEGQRIVADNLYDSRAKGAFNESYEAKISGTNVRITRYWSNTGSRSMAQKRWATAFVSDKNNIEESPAVMLRCRLVRLEPVA